MKGTLTKGQYSEAKDLVRRLFDYDFNDFDGTTGACFKTELPDNLRLVLADFG